MNDAKLREVLGMVQTPLYVFDTAELSRRICFLRNQLPAPVGLCFAVKANPFLLGEISGLVERLEICSPGELRICQRLDLPSEQFVISGVYKAPALIHELLAENRDIGIYTIESKRQFALLYLEARSKGRRLPILLRLTSGNQFGMNETDVEEIITYYQNDLYLDICGIQYFSGTQKASLKRLERELSYLDDFLEHLRISYGYQAKELEFGPGFPVSYFQGEEWNESEFLCGFSELLSGMRFRGKIILEIGRSIAASCGNYMTRVVDIKKICDQNCAIVDGGIHQLVYYGQSMAMKRPDVHILQPFMTGNEEEWSIFGSLCTINDILVKRLPMTGLRIGDILVFENTGAYCMTEGISLFLSRELPAVILLQRDGTPVLVRSHTPVDFLNTPIMKEVAEHGTTD